MDDSINTFDLSPEQEDTTALIKHLLGQRPADRYVDFCRLAAGAIPLRVSIPMAGHALRELELDLRQKLRAPMEATKPPSKEELERIETAKDQLRLLGFDPEAIQRACEKLKPQLHHRQEIEMIVTRLGLAPDGDIARAWKSISDAHSQAHKGHAFHHSVEVDDSFRAEWQVPFDTMIRGLMVALRGKYATFMQRVEQLAAMADRSAAVTSFSQEIPGTLSLLSHFFNQLQTPDWLPHLAKRNLLAPPLSLPDDAGSYGLPLRQWPAGIYLLRMAQSADENCRAAVTDALRGVAGSTHPDVQQIGIEILAALPADEAAALVEFAEGWLTPEARFIVARGPHDLIKSLAQGGEGDAALRVTRAVFKLFDENGELATLFSQHMYEHYLPGAVKAVAPVCKHKAVALVADLLDEAAHLSGRVRDDPPHDYTYYLSSDISEEGIKHDVIDCLIGEVIRAAKLALEADPECIRDVVSIIRSHSPKIFTRLALHVLSLNPGGAPDLAQAYLTDKTLVEATWCRSEYGDLALAWFPSLSKPVQDELLAIIDSVPGTYRDGWKQRFEDHEKTPPTASDERRFYDTTVRDLVWHWRAVLPADRQQALVKVVDEFGEPNAWQERIFEDASSPLSAQDFSARPVDEIVAFLETWRPSSGETRETATALAQELRNAAASNPTLYSANAPRFAELPAIYVRNVLQGLENACKNENKLDWNGALALIATVARHGAEPSLSGMEGDDKDWSWSRKAAVELLASGLRQGAKGIPNANAALVQELILKACSSAPRLPDTEEFEGRYRNSPYFAAQSTSRGAAVELAVLLMFWLSKNPDSEVGKAPRKALEKLPDIRQVFETELADRTLAGRIPRAIIGRYLNWLFYFAEPWLREHLTALFPGDDLSLRDAAWLSHLLVDSGPNEHLAPSMRECYVAEIDRLSAESATDGIKRNLGDRLAAYLVRLYICGAFSDDIFELFWATAPVRTRRHAIWFLGTALELPPDKLADDLRERAFSYWSRRLTAAKASTAPDYFREEIGTIGQFFFRNSIDGEWLMDQVLSMSEAGFAPSEPYSVIERLSKLSVQFPNRAAEVLAALVRNPRFNNGVYMTHSAAVRIILENGLKVGSPATESFVMEAINHLAAMGDTSYLGLLRRPQA